MNNLNKLSKQQAELYNQIRRAYGSRNGGYEKLFNKIPALFKELKREGLISELRIQYFINPEFQTGRGKSSWEEIIRQNYSKNQISTSPIFPKFLIYFVEGPQLHSQLLTRAHEIFKEAHFSDEGADKLVSFIKENQRLLRYEIPTFPVEEEVFKLLIEYEVPTYQARSIRQKILRWKN